MQQLVQKAVYGDPKAFTDLYNHYITPIYRFIYFRVRSNEEAEDLTQTVFLKAWSSLSHFQGSASFSSWLYTIARHTVIDYWKKKKDVSLDDEETFFKNVKDKAPHQGMLLEVKDDTEKIFMMMRELSADQQEILLLRFVQDLSTTEIALVMNRKKSAVRALQYRALEQLRKLLAKKNNA